MRKKEYPIGTYFKKENIFLATIENNLDETYKIIQERLKGIETGVPEEILKELIYNFNAFSSQYYDIFYKDENGYTCFCLDGSETFKGDNSDGKGFIKNVIPVWDYYSEDELFELVVNGKYIAIGADNPEPMDAYNRDYNIEKTKKLTLE